MKYEVITDEDNYVQIIRHTNTKRDFAELDLNDYDFSNGRLFAYQLGVDELFFDENKYKEIQDAKQKVLDQKEIKELEQLLKDSDYIIARWGEEIVSLNNPLTWIADVIKINRKYFEKYMDLFSKRKRWRERIEELLNGD